MGLISAGVIWWTLAAHEWCVPGHRCALQAPLCTVDFSPPLSLQGFPIFIFPPLPSTFSVHVETNIMYTFMSDLPSDCLSNVLAVWSDGQLPLARPIDTSPALHNRRNSGIQDFCLRDSQRRRRSPKKKLLFGMKKWRGLESPSKIASDVVSCEPRWRKGLWEEVGY